MRLLWCPQMLHSHVTLFVTCQTVIALAVQPFGAGAVLEGDREERLPGAAVGEVYHHRRRVRDQDDMTEHAGCCERDAEALRDSERQTDFCGRSHCCKSAPAACTPGLIRLQQGSYTTRAVSMRLPSVVKHMAKTSVQTAFPLIGRPMKPQRAPSALLGQERASCSTRSTKHVRQQVNTIEAGLLRKW